MKMRKPVWLLLLFILLGGLGAAGYLGYDAVFGSLPAPEALSQRLVIPSVRIVDRHGRLLYEALAEEGGRHGVVPLEAIPLSLRQATIATEDARFYTHPGIDLRGILRAAWINLRGGETVSGGSTITQQVVRNLLLSPEERGERSLRRKLREALLAWQLTRRLGKDEILALYLNQTYYGGMAYGVEAAAQTYFGKPVAELDLAEAALLAGLPQAPALYNPFTYPEAAVERQRIVLGLMEKAGFIEPDQRLLAERERLVFAATPYPMQAPHFVMLLRAWLDALAEPGGVLDGIDQQVGLVVRTSLDLDWQQHAEGAIRRQIAAMQRSEDGLGHNLNSAALVALDPLTGEILALVGSPDYFDAGIAGAINMALAPRQPGSALKPLVYAAALDPTRPAPWTAATLLLDVRTSFLTHDGQAYVPANYDLREHGPVLVRQALGSSLNIPAVLALDHIGLDELFGLAAKLGITTFGDPHDYDLTLALGGGEVRLLELTAAYAAFASGGYRVDPAAILEIGDLQGNVLYTAPPTPRVRVLDERVAWLVSDMLSDNDARMLGFGANSILRLGRPAAVKTGTTTNFHDNWTVGYTPGLVVGVWAGNTNYEPMRDVNGLSGAAPVWHEFMRAVLVGQPVEDFRRPPGLARTEICALSGLLPSEACPYRRWEWFIEGTQPTRPDSFYRTVTIDQETGALAGEGTPPERRRTQLVLDLPPQAHPWARRAGLTLLSDLVAGSPQALIPSAQSQGALNLASLRLVSPAAGSLYRMAPGFSSEAQQIQLEAAGEAGLRQVTLLVDATPIATLERRPYTAWWRLEPGVHQAWAEGLREDGERVVSETISFEVK